MTVFIAKSINGGLSLGSEHNRARLKQHLRDNPGMTYRIEAQLPESEKQRKFYHGAVLPLWAYLNGWDYEDSEILRFLHHEAKKEFNGEMVMLDKKMVKRGKSSKGKLQHLVESLVTYLEENYAIDREKVLSPSEYKYWRDVVYSNGGPETYIAYLKELNHLA